MIEQSPLPGLFSEESQLKLRPHGWALIANTGGSQGYHIVDMPTPGDGVRTVCGVLGRVIDSPTVLAIVPCPACEAGTS